MTQREQAEGIVKTNVLWSMGAGVIPIPFVDSAAVLVVQLDMLRQLSAFYGHDFSETSGRSWISTLTAGYATRIGAQFLAQGLKLIPVIGSVIGGASIDYNFSSNEHNDKDNYEQEFRMKTINYMYEVGIGMDFYLDYFKFSPSIRGVFAINNELVRDNAHDFDANGKAYSSPWTGPIDYFGTRGIFLNFSFE